MICYISNTWINMISALDQEGDTITNDGFKSVFFTHRGLLMPYGVGDLGQN